MESALTRLALIALAALLTSCGGRKPEPTAIRVAVIGGMVITGLWDAMANDFTRRTGVPVEVVASGPKDVLDQAVRGGGVDLVTMHSSDTATTLAADGLGERMRPWARNELVVVGPTTDPAGVRGWRSGAEALRRIAETQSPFVEARNVGSQTVCARLWQLAGIRPSGEWLLRDDSPAGAMVVEFAAARGAYVVVGRIPVLTGKMPAAGMEILVEGDPEMRRPYVVLECPRGPNPAGARHLADFLVSADGQNVLRAFADAQGGSAPIFYPGAETVPAP